jgi:hypothetical protein
MGRKGGREAAPVVGAPAECFIKRHHAQTRDGFAKFHT